jgi:hypothetical protein
MNFMETTILSNIAAPNTDTNQAAASQNSGVAPNNITSGDTSGSTSGSTSELKITSFSWIDITETTTNNSFVIGIGVNCTGFYTKTGSNYDFIVDPSGPEFKAFVDKGVKIRLLKGTTLVKEEISIFEGSDSKKFRNLITNGFYMGESTPQFGTGVVNNLTYGDDYVLECWYNGSKVCVQNVQVRNQAPFFKYYN